FETEMADTVFICGNPHSDWLLEGNDFLLLDEVWRYGWDNDLGTLPPRPVTDRAIEVGRSENPQRMILHYMQPHYPFISEPDLDYGIDLKHFGELPWDNIWDRLRKGEIDQERVLNAYRDNLKHVLDDIDLLLRNIEADRAVITSDHGNAIGEWGIYGHPMHMPLDVLQTVPWVLTTGTDNQTYQPETISKQNVDSEVQEQLRQLGYQ
ncbi:MAG: hypothetical protein ABEI86_03380, partial [Halobacteriaceae archaeon]